MTPRRGSGPAGLEVAILLFQGFPGDVPEE